MIGGFHAQALGKRRLGRVQRVTQQLQAILNNGCRRRVEDDIGAIVFQIVSPVLQL